MQVTLDKAMVLKGLTENRAKFVDKFKVALTGWRAKFSAHLRAQADIVESGKTPMLEKMPRPENHTSAFDGAISLLEKHQGDMIDLDERDARRYVEGKFGWERRWAISNAAYTGDAIDATGDAIDVTGDAIDVTGDEEDEGY